MLSKRFEDIVKKINNDKTIAQELNNQQRVDGYKNLLNTLRIIGILLNGANIQSDYYNYVSRGILSDDFINDGIMHPHYLKGLKILDFFDKDNKKIINKILNVFNEDYVLSSEFYDDMDFFINNEQYKCNEEKLLMELHYKIMIDKIYFLWQTNPQHYNYYIKKFNGIISRYDKKINFKDLNNYNNILSLINEMFDVVTHSDEYFWLFTFMEEFIKKQK